MQGLILAGGVACAAYCAWELWGLVRHARRAASAWDARTGRRLALRPDRRRRARRARDRRSW